MNLALGLHHIMWLTLSHMICYHWLSDIYNQGGLHSDAALEGTHHVIVEAVSTITVSAHASQTSFYVTVHMYVKTCTKTYCVILNC